ncbi:Agglutinin-2 [Morella rubra]|uniref:Agglutinin-2 n=1 Tax=Morella rubra TaxID=262757 RepID=A0A6A1VL97_9ROSI|nr:Agglutinin-2 [Morella rubra]
MPAMSLTSLMCFKIPFLVLFIFTHFFSRFAQSLSFSIRRFDPKHPRIHYEGDASASNGDILLNTNDRPYGVGRATYVKPLHLWDDCSLTHQADFTTHFSFTMDNVSESEGAGLAFFLAPFGNTAPLNSGGENLGLFDQYPSTTGSAKGQEPNRGCRVRHFPETACFDQ